MKHVNTRRFIWSLAVTIFGEAHRQFIVIAETQSDANFAVGERSSDDVFYKKPGAEFVITRLLEVEVTSEAAPWAILSDSGSRPALAAR